MNAHQRIGVLAVVGVVLVVAVGVAGHELGLRGVGAFALPFVVGVVVGSGILAWSVVSAD